MNQLRDHLTEKAYLERLVEKREQGYHLFRLFDDERTVSVAGVTPKTNFYNGRHLFVYDLSGGSSVGGVQKASDGVHNALARERGHESVVLESGLWRDDAHRFYEDRLEMDRYCYSFKLDFEDE